VFSLLLSIGLNDYDVTWISWKTAAWRWECR